MPLPHLMQQAIDIRSRGPHSKHLLLSEAFFCIVAGWSALALPRQVGAQATPQPTMEPAKSLAIECAKSEESVIEHPGSYLRYRMREVNQRGEQLREQIETPQGTVARLIERDGHSLTPEQDAAERSRLNAMLTSPDDFIRHVRRDEEGRKSGLEVLHLMPDAMLWSYAPGQPQLPGHSADDPPLIVLDFKPDPNWQAPNLQAELLTGLEGRVWIDSRTRRVVHLEAATFRAVNVGWGFLAHVYAGGTVSVDQVEATNDRWIMRHMSQQFTVRALLVKQVRQQTVSEISDYRAVPSMSYQDAVQLLLNMPLPQR